MTSFNRKSKTIDCLTRLFAQNGIGTEFKFDVYLTDDGSSDGTAAEVRGKFPSVNLIEGDGSLFWNRGTLTSWQQAANKASYDFYMWLNDDTNLVKDAIRELLSCYKAYQEEAVVCGAICSDATKDFTYGGRDKKGGFLLPDGNVKRCYTINGNCVLISRNVFLKVGFLDPFFRHSLGDYDYGFRSQQEGFSLITTTKYVGYCEKNLREYQWYSSRLNLIARFRKLYSPLGCPPHIYFRFDYRHRGLWFAILHYVTIHLRALIPVLWR
jgi:GT2 family glycosyltransferase